jgi:hypothetical protein
MERFHAMRIGRRICFFALATAFAAGSAEPRSRSFGDYGLERNCCIGPQD